MVPALTETATRLPLGAPLVSSPDAPALQNAITGALVLFLIGAALQVRQLLRNRPTPIPTAQSASKPVVVNLL